MQKRATGGGRIQRKELEVLMKAKDGLGVQERARQNHAAGG